MHRVLSIPEIVERIIKLVESPDISACVYVCKLWSEFALDEKWETIDWDCFMDNLFTILFPQLHERIDDVRNTSKLPDELSDDSHWKTQADWGRFRYYARRIKYLCCDSDDFSRMDCEVMAILARTCPHPHIFPHLYSFTAIVEPDMNGSITYVAKYFCESLRSLALNLTDLSSISPFRRLGALESLVIKYSNTVTLTDAELLDLVKSLPRLTILQLSPAVMPPIRLYHRPQRSSLTLNSLALLSHQPNNLRKLHLRVRNGPDVDLNTDLGVHLKGLTDLVIDHMGVSDPLSFITDVNDFMNRCLSEECVRSMVRS